MKLLATIVLAALAICTLFFTANQTAKANLVGSPPISSPVLTPLINEFSSNGTNEWIELFNPLAQIIDLNGWKLTDNGGSGRSFLLNGQSILPSNFFVVSFNLGLNDAGDSIKLFDQNNNLVDLVSFGNDLNPVTRAPGASQSAYRAPDGSNYWEVSSNITKGYSNYTPKPSHTPKPTITPQPTITPTPTTPHPTISPIPTVTPIPTITPQPSITPTPTQSPSPIPTNPPSSNPDNPSGTGGPASAPICIDQKPGSAPTLLSVVLTQANQVKLVWLPAKDPVSYYLVSYGTTPEANQFGNPNVGGKDTRTYVVSNLVPNQNYYFRVRGGNGCAPGDFSNVVSTKSTSPIGGVLGISSKGAKGGNGNAVNLETTSASSPVYSDLVQIPFSEPFEKQPSFLENIWSGVFKFFTGLFK